MGVINEHDVGRRRGLEVPAVTFRIYWKKKLRGLGEKDDLNKKYYNKRFHIRNMCIRIVLLYYKNHFI